ncbi:MAG TPA: MBL fold metallo-hydrolase [Xanthomonadaceae bacterium]|nr:MBL fold metallo-hydrolase [Xanthomonadaceae bacterium]
MADSSWVDAHGIGIIDTGFHRPRFDASYLLVEKGRAAYVDTGINASLPRLLGALEQRGLERDAVDWVILTHVHLDHAGGAGALMRTLPDAKLVVHPRGAPHMTDPSRLVAGASAVYGAAHVQETYGELPPVLADRVVEAGDGHVVDLAGRELLCLDAPGHARHHIVIRDAASRCFFTGDTFGLSYREFDTARGPFILPTTTPVQFDPEALKTSIARMLAMDPPGMYLTHFGRVEDVPRLAEDLESQIDAMVAIGRRHASANDRHARITADLADLYLERLRAHGCELAAATIRTLLDVDIELNAQGLEVWLDRR